MELTGKFGINNDLKTSLGLLGLGQQFWNLSPAELIEDCIIIGDGMLTDTGALAIETGEFTGRSPKDRYIVSDAITESEVWWGDVNIAYSPDKFDALHQKMVSYLEKQEIAVEGA